MSPTASGPPATAYECLMPFSHPLCSRTFSCNKVGFLSLLDLPIAVAPHIAFLKLSNTDEILDHDQNLLRFLGVDSSLLGQSFLQYIASTDEEQQDLITSFPEAWQHLSQPTMITLRKQDNRLFYAEIQAQCDEHQHYLLWIHDVNTHHCNMHELREEICFWKNKEQIASQKSHDKSDFLSTISHELRTNLHGLLGMQRMVSDIGTLSDEQQSCLSAAQISARSLKDLVDHLFDISSLECGHSPLHHEPFKLYETLRDIMVAVSHLAKKKGLQFHLELNNVPTLIEGDVQRFRQIVKNLIHNAVHFTDTGHVTVRASIQDKKIWVEVEDTGHGISEAYQNELCLKNESNTWSRNKHLGICIVRRFVNLMGGKIKVCSTLGQGTSVAILIPLRFLEPTLSSLKQNMLDHSIENPTNEADEKRSEGRKFQGMRVLLAEDDPIEQAVMYQRLRNEGFRYVDKAVCGNTAWAMARTQHYHLIFLDVQMPGLNGIEVTTRIREIERKKKREKAVIIALTAHTTPDMKNHCLQAGMNDFMTKPHESHEIMKVVTRRLNLT